MNAAYAIVAAPLLGAIVLLFAGRRLGQPSSGWLATALSFAAFVATVLTWLSLLGRSPAHRSVYKGIYTWIPVAGLHVRLALLVDPLSMTMALFVTGVGSLIHLYSIGYMKGDRSFPRFFFLLNLFLFSMVVLILADNYLFSFLGWEGVGFCSYGLVGFWFERESAAVAAKKAFVTNRVGDFGFMIALFLMFDHFGSFSYRFVLSPLASGHATLAGDFATGLGLMLILGAVGKSAQIPLYMWLPDAMEGPTPVSALIHAATMVTAGVYLIARSAPILHFSSADQLVIACLGTATAFIASTIACASNDIKRILAYSTLAELGFMFLAEGSGSYSSGIFLMVTHAFFKALLFLGAGSVIHAMSDEQDIKKMGGLRRYLPITFVTFVIGYLALSAVPPFSGWWSHDAVLDAAWHKNKILWAVGVITDGLTAYYMSREFVLVFLGKARWHEPRAGAREAGTAQGGEAGGPQEPTPAFASTSQGHPGALAGEGGYGAQTHSTGEAQGAGQGHGPASHGVPHESPWVMTVPLVILAVGAFLGGLLNFPAFHWDFITRFLAPVFPHTIAPPVVVPTATKWIIGTVGTIVIFVGLVAGLRAWRGRVERPELEPAFLRHGWFIDEAVAAAVSGPLAGVASGLAYEVDARLLDGGVNALARFIAATGRQLRRMQTGYVRTYALGIAIGAVLILTYVATRVGS